MLVTGASGRLGRLVLNALLAHGAQRIIATTRSPEHLADMKRLGVDVRFADHDRPETLGDAYRGARRMLVISSYSVGRRADQMRQVVEAAKAAGVRHICYTSTTGARPSDDPVTNDHFWSETAIQQSGLTWTMLRHNMFAEHVPLAVAAGIVTGTLTSPIGDMGRGYVTRRDCALADAGALANCEETCRIIDVTGPAIVSQTELARIASRLAGRTVVYRSSSRDGAIASWTAAGMPEHIAQAHADYDLFAAEGHHALATRAVALLGGAEPEPIESFLLSNRAVLMPTVEGQINLAAIERL